MDLSTNYQPYVNKSNEYLSIYTQLFHCNIAKKHMKRINRQSTFALPVLSQQPRCKQRGINISFLYIVQNYIIYLFMLTFEAFHYAQQ